MDTITAKKTIFDYMTEEEYNRYTALVEKAAEAKANAPKKPREKKPMTAEQKVNAMQKQRDALQAKIDALLAAQAAHTFANVRHLSSLATHQSS